VRRTRNTTQHSGRTHRRSATIVAATILAIGALAATAAAVVVGTDGGAQLGMHNRTDTTSYSTNNTVWTNLPDAADVQLGEGHLINARFTAESKCSGPAAGTCVVRIIATNANGMIELDPPSGADFAFDTDLPGAGAADALEGHAMERSIRLGNNGPYTIRVQYAVTNANTTFTVDDLHFAVEESV
jgi:hypothetical protein